MSEFEWVMLLAWAVMLFMYWRANRRARFLAHCLIAVGKGEYDDKGNRKPLDVKPKDKILFGKYAGTEIKIDGVEHLIMRESDILAIIE